VCLPVDVGPDNFENRQYRDASPLTHVTPDDSPMLLMHGDEDLIVPIRQIRDHGERAEAGGCRREVHQGARRQARTEPSSCQLGIPVYPITWAKPSDGLTRS
jgi:hypothetical protein